ncbi:heavy metal-translocating P-type ATPase, Cd/Co/Hg/Pb/Zn-transporting [Belliella baltica DSM 15883]|uniref:P-type Zn(2+) transporter n=1 Tax=Belliella baltica (strain DSM 15883 / CIP 108006 / LMG 21964 / BA134) TaxID=866536 RepID=I3Z3S4_BELBD|nr:heavy metal translocating P-type ATPase [Belliella baltica]AFL83892.1 heavy metal-translocating P-type ATPase, Cd/Co/Hg/Pb/Zn-transporting [Belliella baltica DSM 15883]
MAFTNDIENKACCNTDPQPNKQTKQVEKAPSTFLQTWGSGIVSLIMLLAGIAADQLEQPAFFNGWIRIGWYVLAYLPVGWPVLVKGWKSILRGDVFTEFFLMGIATLGAFAIGEYPEAVAVMLFYAIGELFQDAAVNRAKRNIKALLDIRPDSASVYRSGQMVSVHPEEVQIGETIQVKPGEKIPLDGEMISEKSSFNTSALTGESKPATYNKGENVLAGMVNLDRLIELKVTRRFNESSLARILELVQNATARKAKTEQFIRKFARVYTPIVTFLAVGLTFLPYFFVENYVFEDWLYRALIFLVISCPCALVISIPLGYFGGIGAASRKGILFKGSNFLDLMTKVNTVVMDKTGTLTKGVFEVQKAVTMEGITTDWLSLAAAMESKSTHPIAKAITEYTKKQGGKISEPEQQEEIAGHGLKGKVNSKHVLIGNQKLMDKEGIVTCADAAEEVNTVIHVAVDQKYAGYLVIADELKEDAAQAINALHKSGVRELIMLSGDKNAVTQQVAKSLGIDKAFGDLLPEQKVEKVEELKKDTSRVIAFVGDGINDAPVLALADVGMAMGGLGSDAAIETADVVIQTDQPSKIATAIQIGKQTKRIVWQNIGLAFGVKVIVLALGAGGLATMWEAVFADVGVALLAILNAVRMQK